jgi:hypothetical protein
MIEFVHGRSVAKGVRHMELRMFYVREKYRAGSIIMDFMTGETILTDKLTKIGDKPGHFTFTKGIMGLILLERPNIITKWYQYMYGPDIE